MSGCLNESSNILIPDFVAGAQNSSSGTPEGETAR